MILIWGSGNYGKCDEVPGLCHTVTRFGHLYYIPLIPTGSFAVISEESDGGFRGASIPMSGKSLLLGWGRAALLVGVIFGVWTSILGAMAFAVEPESLWTGLVALIGCGSLLIASYRMRYFSLASRERAIQIAGLLGLDEEGVAMIEEMYDAMDTPTKDDDFVYNRGFVAEDPRF